MFTYSVENEFATFRRAAKRFGAAANAEAGMFVEFLPPDERNRRRTRQVQVSISETSFTLHVPYHLGRELRTVVGESPDLINNLAKCFERAHIATMSKDLFQAMQLDEICGAFESYKELMQNDGYDAMALDLMRGLGKDNYEVLVEAIRRDLGFEDLPPLEQTPVVKERVEHRSASASVAGQPMVLFPT